MNHWYIGDGLAEPDATELNRRLDFLAARDDVLMAVGANNGSSNPIPQLWLCRCPGSSPNEPTSNPVCHSGGYS